MSNPGLLGGWTSRQLTPPGPCPLSRVRAARSASPLAPGAPLAGLWPSRAAQGADDRPDLAPGLPLAPPAAPLVAPRRPRPSLRASAPRTERAPQAGGLVASPPPRPGPSRRDGGAKTPGSPSLGRSRGGGGAPKRPLGAAEAHTALVFAHSPGPAAAPAGRPWRIRRGPPPESPALLRDRATLAGARGSEPVGPPWRSRVGPWASARELDTRRTAIARGWRRLKGCRRLRSRCGQRDGLFLGCIGFALIINALREW